MTYDQRAQHEAQVERQEQAALAQDPTTAQDLEPTAWGYGQCLACKDFQADCQLEPDGLWYCDCCGQVLRSVTQIWP